MLCAAKGTLHPEAIKSLQDMGDQYAQQADELAALKLPEPNIQTTKSRIGRLSSRPRRFLGAMSMALRKVAYARRVYIQNSFGLKSYAASMSL